MNTVFLYVRTLVIILCLTLFAGLVSAAPTPANNKNTDKGTQRTTVKRYADPYEHYNRKVYAFNDALDRHFLKPIARFYNKVMPRPLNTGVNNFFSNLDEMPTIFNDLLQVEFYQAMADTWRFGVNTTVGVGGFFDVARHMQLKNNYQDFNLTLAKWGWVHSRYMVLPLIGPSTVRGSTAWPVDYVTSPYFYIRNFYWRWGLYSGDIIAERAQLLQYQPLMKQVVLDPYVFMRNAYLQNQAYLIKQNQERKGATATGTQRYLEKQYRYPGY